MALLTDDELQRFHLLAERCELRGKRGLTLDDLEGIHRSKLSSVRARLHLASDPSVRTVMERAFPELGRLDRMRHDLWRMTVEEPLPAYYQAMVDEGRWEE